MLIVLTVGQDNVILIVTMLQSCSNRSLNDLNILILPIEFIRTVSVFVYWHYITYVVLKHIKLHPSVLRILVTISAVWLLSS